MNRIFKYRFRPSRNEDGELVWKMVWCMLGKDFKWKTIDPVYAMTREKLNSVVQKQKDKGNEMLYDEAL